MGRRASQRRAVHRSASGTVRLPAVPGVHVERGYWADGAVVAGVDEVGRGAWAGKLTVGALVLPSDRRMYKLRDSKVLDPARREELAARLESFALGIGLGDASNEEIDALGLSAALALAAQRAVAGLPLRPDVVLLDGDRDFLGAAGVRTVPLPHGDASSASIAAASIVAKVARDRAMMAAAERFPGYRFERNKGYCSPDHRAALERLGPCALHRRSWAPVAAARSPRLPLEW